MKKQLRYPGIQPFRPYQDNIFFGRSQEIKKILQLISLEKLSVIYSKSGMGKSSIINAGILPAIDKADAYETIQVRFGSYAANNFIQPTEEVIEAIKQHQATIPLFANSYDYPETLWTTLKSSSIIRKDKKGILLVFDQFEELFTYPEELIIDFKKSISEALYTIIPQEIYQLTDQQGSSKISQSEVDFLHEPVKLKIVIAIRSDRLHFLNNLKDYLPDILVNTYELGTLKRNAAEDAIILPAHASGEQFLSNKFDFSDASIELVLDYLSKDNTHDIEPFQLQLLCQSIENKVIENNYEIIEKKHVDGLDLLYEDFYDSQIKSIGTEQEQLLCRKLIEEGLILEEEKRRLILYEGQIMKSYGVSPNLLTRLVNSHIIRSEPSLRGGFVYELCHDSFIEPVLKAREKRIADYHKAIEEKEKKRKEQELIEERKKNRRVSLLAATGFLLFAFALVASIFAFRQAKIAEAANLRSKQALEQFVEAQRQKNRLEIDKLVQNAAIYAEADELGLALSLLEQALEIDSTNQIVLDKIEEYQNTRGLE